MDTIYCLKKIAEAAKEKEQLKDKVFEFSEKLDKAINSSERSKYITVYNYFHNLNYEDLLEHFQFEMLLISLKIRLESASRLGKEDEFGIYTEENCELFERLMKIKSAINFWKYTAVDSKPMRFDGDIIITDPCYIRDHSKDNTEEELDCYSWAEEHGIYRDTIYGDWSCTTYNKDTAEELGSFCADSGTVCVVPLKDVLDMNPNFDYHIKCPWTTTLIKDFHGYVYFEVKEEKYIYEGKEETEYTVHVVGLGNTNFYTTQTGL